MAIATLSLIDFLDLNWERHLRPGTCSVGRADFHFCLILTRHHEKSVSLRKNRALFSISVKATRLAASCSAFGGLIGRLVPASHLHFLTAPNQEDSPKSACHQHSAAVSALRAEELKSSVTSSCRWRSQRLLDVFSDATARPSTFTGADYNQLSTTFFQNVNKVLTGAESGKGAVDQVDQARSALRRGPGGQQREFHER
jgi:hypothetical protein